MILIGLRFAGAAEFDTFRIGVTSAVVHERGKIDWFKEWLTISWREGMAASPIICILALTLIVIA